MAFWTRAGQSSGQSSLGAEGASAKSGGMDFEEVVEKYHGKVFQLVYRYCGDYDEACDLTQDTFVRAFNAWGEFRGEAQIYTWLYRIALNLCHNHKKKLTRRNSVELLAPEASGDDAETRSLGNIPDERPLPLQSLESEELRHRLHQALLQLPENYRTVIVLRDIEDLSYEQIAQITDSTLEAIKSRLFRARHALREQLAAYMRAEPDPTPAPHADPPRRRGRPPSNSSPPSAKI
jgi:RNA polymerase sigma-70 factor (ECF subfamily)